MKTTEVKSRQTKTVPLLNLAGEKREHFISTSIFYAVVSFLFSLNSLSLMVFPISFALIASLPINYLMQAGVGSVVGYLLLGDIIVSSKFITVTLIILSVKWIFTMIYAAKNEMSVNVVSLVGGILISETIQQLVTGVTFYGIMSISVEVIFSVLLSYIFYSLRKEVERVSEVRFSFSFSRVYAIHFTLVVALLLYSVDVMFNLPVSFTKVGLGIVLLAYTFKEKEGVGLSVAIVAGFLISVFYRDATPIALSYCLAGVVCSSFSVLGKMPITISFLICNLVGVIVTTNGNSVMMLVEPVIVFVVFTLIKTSFLDKLFMQTKTLEFDEVKNNNGHFVNQKIKTMANSLENIGIKLNDFNKNSKRLDRKSVV